VAKGHHPRKQWATVERRLNPPGRKASPSAIPATPAAQQTRSFAVDPDERGDWSDFVIANTYARPLAPAGTAPRYKVKLYAGSSEPELAVSDGYPVPSRSYLHLPGQITVGGAAGHDSGSAPEFMLNPDRRGLLDTIETIIEARHIEPSTIRPFMVEGHDIGIQRAAEEEAHRRIVQWLGWCSFMKRVPIWIHAIYSEDLVYGFQHGRRRIPFTVTHIDRGELLEGIADPEFMRAFGLYREALCSDNSLYKFLTFCKAWELIDGTEGYVGLRTRINQGLRQLGLNLKRPKEMFLSGPYTGKTYTEALKGELKMEYRHAVAHVQLETGQKKRPDDLADVRSVEDACVFIHKAIRDMLTHEVEAHRRLQEGLEARHAHYRRFADILRRKLDSVPDL